MEEGCSYNLEELFSYVYHSDKYYKKLEKAILNELWEYATILVWKTIILFIYEDLFQIKKSDKELPEDIERQLKVNNITCYSCFDFTCLKDDNLYTNLNKIWANVENFYKELFKGLLNKRNGLSHVNKYEEDFNKQWFETYFDESIKLLKYLQELHDKQIIEEIHEKIIAGEFNDILSEKDIYYLLNESGVLESKPQISKSKVIEAILEKRYHKNLSEGLKEQIKESAIESLSNSYSFDSAETNGKLLLKISDEFNKFDIEKVIQILIGELGYANSQIFGAGNMEEVIIKLFEDTINIPESDKFWNLFFEALKSSTYTNKFPNLLNRYKEFLDSD